MKTLILPLFLVALVACAQTIDTNIHMMEDDIAQDDMMQGMPCHQMLDGSWMGNCDTKSEVMNLGKATQVANAPQIVRLNDGDTYEITAAPVTKLIDGKEVTMLAYNGMIPGPIIASEKGAKITVDFKNELEFETTIHWHGLRHDNKDDGVPGVTQKAVQPNEEFRYTLQFPDDGLFWYHPHVREDLQQDLGLAGTMLISPESQYQEEVLVLDDILIDENGVVPFGTEHATHAMMGRFGNVMLVNGAEKYELQSEGNLRIYVANVANVRPFNISIPGAVMKLVGSDLSLYERDFFVESVIIAPAERYIVEVQFPSAGEYNIVHKTPFGEKKLAVIQVQSAGEIMTLNENEAVIADVASFAEDFDKEPDNILELDSQMNHMMPGMMQGHVEPIEWEDTMAMMNGMMDSSNTKWVIRDATSGLENMDLAIKAQVGDRLKLRLVNSEESMHPMQHPFHIHGQRFLVTHIDGVPIDNKVWKDTVLVPAASTVDILVDISNPGMWMMHCHIAEHLEAGMMSMLVVK